MRKSLLLPLITLLLAGIASAADKSQQIADSVAPFVDEQTIAVGYADLSAVDLDAIVRWVTDTAKKLNADPLWADAPELAVARQWLADFRKAGGRSIYVVVDPGDVPGVPIIAPIEQGADANAIVKLFTFEPPQAMDSRPEVIGNAVVYAPANVRDRLRRLKPAPRPELATALAAAGDMPLRGAVMPSKDFRRVLAELMPKLPKEIGGAGTEPITRGISWASAGASLPPKPGANLVIQCQDAASAKALSDLIDGVFTAVVNMPDAKREVPNAKQLLDLIAPKSDGDRLTLSVDSQMIDKTIMPALAPSVQQAQERANRIKSASNLRQIGQGMMLYANDHGKSYPPDLGTIVTDPDLNVEVFVSPSSGRSVPKEIRSASPKEQAKWVNANADYVYLGAGLNMNAPADVILAYEKPEIHKGEGMNVLFGDGHVEWMKVEDAMKQIEKQKQNPPKK